MNRCGFYDTKDAIQNNNIEKVSKYIKDILNSPINTETQGYLNQLLEESFLYRIPQIILTIFYCITSFKMKISMENSLANLIQEDRKKGDYNKCFKMLFCQTYTADHLQKDIGPQLQLTPEDIDVFYKKLREEVNKKKGSFINSLIKSKPRTRKNFYKKKLIVVFTKDIESFNNDKFSEIVENINDDRNKRKLSELIDNIVDKYFENYFKDALLLLDSKTRKNLKLSLKNKIMAFYMQKDPVGGKRKTRRKRKISRKKRSRKYSRKRKHSRNRGAPACHF